MVFVVLIMLGFIFNNVFLIWCVKNGIMLIINGINVVVVLIVVFVKICVNGWISVSIIMKGIEW